MPGHTFRSVLRTLGLGVLTLIGSATPASNNPTVPASGPPRTYRIEDVRIHMVRAEGRSTGPPRQLLLSGAGPGSAVLEQQGQRRQGVWPHGDLVALLNALYRLQFFSLPAQLTDRQSVFLRDDGTVQMQVLRRVDAPSTRVCVTISDYAQCVSFSAEGSAALGQVVDQAFSNAERLVSP
jgi:hypothetical protein